MSTSHEVGRKWLGTEHLTGGRKWLDTEHLTGGR